LDKANQNGYYKEMLNSIRTLLSKILKGNHNLEFAVLTGCLRVSKESIFTGLNNLKVNSITDNRYSEYFGFTEHEVKEMLDYYNMAEQFDVVEQWYDGYRFGNQDIYCPWDVINYCDDFLDDEKTGKEPKAYWTHTSDNVIIQQFLAMSNATTKKEMEQLIEGSTIKKKMHLELTYADFNSGLDTMWSYLFMTGYLTKTTEFPDDVFELKIPNLGIKKIFRNQIQEWFSQSVAREPSKLDEFCNALKTGDAALAEQRFREYLKKTISIRDTHSPLAKKENFYHGILLGLLGHMREWTISSNVESGDGYSDILIEMEDDEIGIVIEVKYAEKGDMDLACRQALAQIEKMHYADTLLDDGMTTIYKYGIACYKKQCRIVLA
jgi:hypothetical protein